MKKRIRETATPSTENPQSKGGGMGVEDRRERDLLFLYYMYIVPNAMLCMLLWNFSLFM